MSIIWKLRLIVAKQLEDNHRQLVWTLDGHQQHLKFGEQVLRQFDLVLSSSLPHSMQQHIRFTSTAMVDNYDGDNCIMIALNIEASQGGGEGGELSEFLHLFEDAIKTIPIVISEIEQSDISPERIKLVSSFSKVAEIKQVKNTICLQLLEKLRRVRSKYACPIALLLPDDSFIAFKINEIAKSTEQQSDKVVHIGGRIISHSDDEHLFFIKSKREPKKRISMPSVPEDIRQQLLKAYLNKISLTISAYPTIEYSCGEQKYKAYQFIAILELNQQLDF